MQNPELSKDAGIAAAKRQQAACLDCGRGDWRIERRNEENLSIYGVLYHAGSVILCGALYTGTGRSEAESDKRYYLRRRQDYIGGQWYVQTSQVVYKQ